MIRHQRMSIVAIGLVALLVARSQAADTIKIENAILKTLEPTTVAAQVPGVIQSLSVCEGMVVAAGQEVGRVRDAAVKLQMARSATAVEIARKKERNDIDERLAAKSQAVAANEYERAVVANRSVPDTYPTNEIDRLKLVAERAELEIERSAHQRVVSSLELKQAETEYQQAQELLDRHRIVAPAAGMVISMQKRVGEWVEPGAELFKTVQTDRLRVEGFVPAREAMQSLMGAKVSVTLADNRDSQDDPVAANSTENVDANSKPAATEIVGTVVFVSPEANPVNSLVRVFVEIENTKGLVRPGLKVNATIHRATRLGSTP